MIREELINQTAHGCTTLEQHQAAFDRAWAEKLRTIETNSGLVADLIVQRMTGRKPAAVAQRPRLFRAPEAVT